MKKVLSIILAAILMISVLPIAVFADKADQTQSLRYCSTVPKDYNSASALIDFEDVVDVDAFKTDLIAAFKNSQTTIDITKYNIEFTNENVGALGGLIYNNFPEAFHVRGLSFSGGIYISELTLILGDGMNAKNYATMYNQMTAAADILLEGIEGNKNLTDVEKALAIHDRLILWNDYDYVDWSSHCAYGALVDRVSVCDGYTDAYIYLLDRVGIKAEYIASDSLDHSWNIVYIDNVPYHVDVTWDDCYSNPTMLSHDNFLRSTDGMIATHHHGNDYPTFATNTKYDNYFWQNITGNFCVAGDDLYYIDQATAYIKKYDNNKSTNVKSVAAIWNYYEGGQYSGNFSNLAGNGYFLYYSLPNKVYSYNVLSKATEAVFTPTAIQNGKQIWGLKYEADYLICYVGDDYYGTLTAEKHSIEPITEGWRGSDADGWWYQYSDGSYATGWMLLDGKWYYFNSKGWMQTGWLKYKTDMYYLDDTGAMQTGWQLIDSKWYYFDDVGVMQTGWIMDGGYWYCLGNDGAWTEEKKCVTHTALNYEEARAATCTEIGWNAYEYCNDCSYTTYAEIPAGHNLVKVAEKAASCTEKGYEAYEYCTECSYATYTEIPAGHILKHVGANAPSCTDIGWQSYQYCTRCDYTTYVEILALGHNKITVDEVPAEIGKKGIKAHEKCMVCGRLFVGEQEVTAAEMVIPALYKEGWMGNSKSGWWYQYSDGKYAIGWAEIDDVWYYFDAKGWMQTGWQQIRTKWYYFDASGAMQTDWQKISGKWYYLNEDGAMLTKWQLIDDEWYYLGTDGAMVTGWKQIGKTWYYFNTSGAMQTYWQKISKIWYYFDADGAMQTGWQEIEGVWYYFKSSGAMVTGTQTINGKIYKFNSSGAWIA